MNPALLFVIGTIAAWIGWALALRAVALLVERSPWAKQLANALCAGVGLGLGAVLTRGTGQANPLTEPGIRIPVAWVAMAWTAWFAFGALIAILVRLVQAQQALTAEERNGKLRAVAVWGAFGAVSFWLFKSNPKAEVVTLRGGINLDPTTAAAIILFAVAAVAAMVVAARNTASRTAAKTVVTQTALVAGCVVFGIPFAYLLITSFKEDRDMSSPNGIVWVPKVQQTQPYMDPKNPLYEAEYQGQRVQGTILERKADGSVRVDITTPLAIRGVTFDAKASALKEIPREVPMVTAKLEAAEVSKLTGASGQTTQVKGIVVENLDDGRQRVRIQSPSTLVDKEVLLTPTQVEPIRNVGLRWQNYTEAISFLPPETNNGLVYLKNTLIIVALSVIGTLLSSALVAYAFSRMRFPGRDALFAVLLSTMMLPAAVTLLPQFLIFRGLGWIDTLLPLWVPAFFGSAFNIFLLRQFFMNIPMELEDAAKIDGCGYLKTFWAIMMPQIKPALAVIAIWTLMGAWNNFMGPLIYVNSPENMPISYALQLFQGDRLGEPGLLMAFTTMSILPVLALFFFAQRYFIEGVTLSGLGGR